MSLEDRGGLLTEASRSIGRALVVGFAMEGAIVAAYARSGCDSP